MQGIIPDREDGSVMMKRGRGNLLHRRVTADKEQKGSCCLKVGISGRECTSVMTCLQLSWPEGREDHYQIYIRRQRKANRETQRLVRAS